MGRKERSTLVRLWLRQILETVTLVLLMLLLIRVTLQNFHIDGHSMEPTLHDQEYILVNKAAYLLQGPARGDIIVFQYPRDPQENYIKRIIATPGDRISIIKNTVSVDGTVLHESYVNKDDPYNPYPAIKQRVVGPDQYFVMGDNRGNSSDSRAWGMVPRRNIIGKAVVVYWPFDVDNLGLLPNESGVFAHVR
ncbi:signal peptidase I [Dictyobacter aurantiacus]|uniref:Signal peptidase I n=1 Tax=Dictyobacter aurantiacus TaxID=1936993 RepID=A0A401ZCU5_9CHLR|nr:signal peptidase I [Dictyobacter aurantiacus]GCE04518.1 signal peptidase I [Dictyobacter aurantiacus]